MAPWYVAREVVPVGVDGVCHLNHILGALKDMCTKVQIAVYDLYTNFGEGVQGGPRGHARQLQRTAGH